MTKGAMEFARVGKYLFAAVLFLLLLPLTPVAWAQSSPPPNDLFANRILVSGLEVILSGTNTTATSEPGEPAHNGAAARKSVWWSWEAPYDGVLRISAPSLAIPFPRWSLYVGDSLTNLTVVASNILSGDVVDVPVQGGTAYQLVVDQLGPSAPVNGFSVKLSLNTLFLSEPTAEARVRADIPVTLVVTNTETDREPLHVDFLANNEWIGSADSAPYVMNWTPGVPGRFVLAAVATNSLAQRRETSPVWITATPTNDNFADAAIIPAETVTTMLRGRNNTASAEPGEPAHANITAARSIWWSWTPAMNGHAELRTTTPVGAALLAVYTGDTLNNLVGVAASEDGMSVAKASFDASAGTTYFIAADGDFDGTNSEVTVELSVATLRFAQPASGVEIFTGDKLELVVTNYGGNEQLASAALWANEQMVIAGITVPGSTLWSTNVPGDYRLRVIGTNNVGEARWSEPILVHVAVVPPPKISVNDNFDQRIGLTGFSNSMVVDISLATTEPGELLPAPCTPIGHTVWWDYLAPTNGILCLQASTGAVCTVFQGESFDSLQMLDSSCSFPFYVPVAAGNHVQIALDGSAADAEILSLTLLFYTAGSNDNFSNAIVMAGTNWVSSGDNILASIEPDEALPLTNSAGRTLWYSWSAPAAGRVSITSSPALFHCALAVYSGPSLNQLIPLASGQDALTFVAETGTVYHLQFDGADGGFGTFSLALDLAPFPVASNDDFADAIALTGISGASDACVSYATLEPGEPTHRSGAPSKSLWWQWEVPLNCSVTLSTASSQATNISLDVYTGSSVEALTLIASGTNNLTLTSVQGGTVLRIAAIADEPTQDYVMLTFWGANFMDKTPELTVPGNLLSEPSFEGTGLELSSWTVSSSGVGGYVGGSGGADGTTWIVLNAGITLSQDVTTVAGQNYEIRFALRPDFGAQSGKLKVRWNGQVIGMAEVPIGEGGYWHWANFTGAATGAVTRVNFEVVEGILGLDAFSVVPMSAPPVIITEPTSASTFVGAVASFLVGASGSPPLAYQWFFNTNSLVGDARKTLTLDPVSLAHAGEYFVVVSNAYGAVTSAPATLVVELPASPTIVLQPYSDSVAVGGYFAFAVAAVGEPPLRYQWFFNTNEISGATNRQFVLASVQGADAGTYSARVWNDSESVWTLPAVLTVQSNAAGGGALLLSNEMPDGGGKRRAWIFDTDGTTRLSGGNYVAQLYAGPALALIRPVGFPQPFQVDSGSNSFAGLIEPQPLVLPTVQPGQTAFAQVRVWEASKGASYEEARALGSKFGKSDVFQAVAGVMPEPPPLWDLQSFSLQAGLPQFVAGRINIAGQQPDGTIEWSLAGQAGYRYVIEKRLAGAVWQPLMVLTNQTGTVLFIDPTPPSTGASLYRARILE